MSAYNTDVIQTVEYESFEKAREVKFIPAEQFEKIDLAPRGKEIIMNSQAYHSAEKSYFPSASPAFHSFLK